MTASGPVVVEESTITAKGQTTVPKAVRQALGVRAGDRISFRVDRAGVTVQRADAAEEDPALDRFLDVLARDIGRRPQAIRALTPALRDRIAVLTRGARVDLDEEIEGEVAL
jgi:antitoxin PrlF